MSDSKSDPNLAPNPGPTPTGYQRTTGGQFRWEPPAPEHLQTLLFGYDSISLIGHGGMGAVYRARQKSLDRLVAIKLLPPEAAAADVTFVERFKNEARTLARLNHPGIVHVHDFGETTNGQLYIVMEYVEGTDVQRMLMDHKKLTPQYALPITAHVCDALLYAHAHGVVHRDIKPANVMLTQEGQLKLADFGLAKLDDPGSSALTQTNMAMGTPDYVAPETLTAGMAVDHRADLYAVGVMLYHMLVGEVPRGAFDLPSKRNPALDPRIDAIVLRAMKQDREERYQSAAEIRAALDAILSTPLVESGGQASAIIPKEAVHDSSKVRGRMPPSDSDDNSAEFDAPTEPKPKSLAWVVPTCVSAVFILGGAFFMRAQRQKEYAPEDPPTQAAPSSSHQVVKVADYQPSSGPKLDPAKWLPFTYPGDFGKNDAGAVEAVDGGGVTVFGGYGQRLRATWTHQDLAVRAHVTLPASGVGIIGLRTDLNKPAVRVAVHPDRIDIVSEVREDTITSDQTVLRSFPGISGPFYQKDGADITFAALGKEYHVWLGDQFLGSVTDGTATAGKALFDGENATFHDMQWQVIGDTSAPIPPTPQALKAEDITGVWSRPDNTSQCILYPDGKITLINKDGQEDLRSDGTPNWTGWRWRIAADKAQLCAADGTIQEEWTLTQPGTVAIKHITRGSISTSKRSSATIPAIRSRPMPAVAKPTPPPPPSQVSTVKSQIPPELRALQATYTAAIAERVTTPHEATMAQLRTGYLSALERAVTARQLTTADIQADQKAIAAKAALPPDIETTPDALSALRTTYRNKASEYDDSRTTAHLALLTPYVAKLRELETSLSTTGRAADAAAVTAYRAALSENPLALPETQP
jgi:serine/threonine protein kinase